MGIITPSQLDTALLTVLAISQAENLHINQALTMLYFYGLRINEVTTLGEITTKITTNEYEIFTKKNNKSRKIYPLPEHQTTLDEAIAAGNNFMPYSIEAIRRYISQRLPIKNATIGNKKSNTHLYRHNKAKQLYQNGISLNQIATYLGITPSIANQYITSVVRGTN